MEYHQNEAHAQKSIEILNAYAGTLREIDMSDNDAPLCAALQGFLLANAAELMRHTYPSVSDTDVKSWENMFRNVFIPVLRNFLSSLLMQTATGEPLLSRPLWRSVSFWMTKVSIMKR